MLFEIDFTLGSRLDRTSLGLLVGSELGAELEIELGSEVFENEATEGDSDFSGRSKILLLVVLVVGSNGVVVDGSCCSS